VTGWTALLLAGQRPGTDPLAVHFGQRFKALVPIAGEAMLSRVARTLLDVPEIARVLVVAQQPEALMTGDCAWLRHHLRVGMAASSTGIASSVAALAGVGDAPWPVLVTTADHPLLTPAMVRAMLAGDGADVGVGVVGRHALLAAYPDNRRTWLVFRGEAWTGANLFTLRSARARKALAAWSEVERDRKKAIKLVWHFGPLLALGALMRLLTLEGALKRAGRRLGCSVRPVALAEAEAGIDVDKPADHALAERILMARSAARDSVGSIPI
jgi:GTP:adenosylcobinamide-phosphate guanylyltransferase